MLFSQDLTVCDLLSSSGSAPSLHFPTKRKIPVCLLVCLVLAFLGGGHTMAAVTLNASAAYPETTPRVSLIVRTAAALAGSSQYSLEPDFTSGATFPPVCVSQRFLPRRPNVGVTPHRDQSRRVICQRRACGVTPCFIHG